MGASHVPSRLALQAPLAILLVSMLSSCNDEPTCSLFVELTGGYEGPLQWSLSGRDSCGITTPTSLESNSAGFAFLDESSGLSQSLYILPEPTQLAIGTFPARVLLVLPQNFWDSQSCEITVTEFVRENWTQIDFFRVEAYVACPEPLTSVSPDYEDVSIVGNLTFIAHVHAESIDYGFL
jgi:hypothetical protein